MVFIGQGGLFFREKYDVSLLLCSPHPAQNMLATAHCFRIQANIHSKGLKLLPHLVVQMVKTPPAVQDTWVKSLGQEDSLEKGMTTHSSILAWIIPWTEKPGGLQSMRLQRTGHD